MMLNIRKFLCNFISFELYDSYFSWIKLLTLVVKIFVVCTITITGIMFQIISQFRDEELEHLSTGLELDAEKVSAQTCLLTACESSTTTMITAKKQ